MEKIDIIEKNSEENNKRIESLERQVKNLTEKNELLESNKAEYSDALNEMNKNIQVS